MRHLDISAPWSRARRSAECSDGVVTVIGKRWVETAPGKTCGFPIDAPEHKPYIVATVNGFQG